MITVPLSHHMVSHIAIYYAMAICMQYIPKNLG